MGHKLIKIYLYSIVLLILGFIVSLSSYLITPLVSADNSTVDRLNINIPSSCTLYSNVTSAHTLDTLGGTYREGIGSTTIKTVCNDSNGFVIYAIGSGNNVEGNNKLVSNIGTEYDIVSGIAGSGNTSNWSMKLSPVSGNYNLTLGEYFDSNRANNDNYNNPFNPNGYTIVPTTWTIAASRPSSTDVLTEQEASEGSSLTTTYAVYVTPTQPAGTYTGQVKYVMFHPSSATRPTTLAEAFKNAGKQKVPATDPITGESGEYYKMQDINTTICSSTNITGEASQMEAVDIRDNKLYWITKMADGKCWMTENLDLDLISDTTAENYVALTSENTNLTLYGSHGYDNAVASGASNGYSCSNNSPTCEGGIITWLPERDTIPPSDLSSTTWKNDNNNPYSYDKGNYEPNGYMNGHGKSGNYYNWTAAIASNNSSSYTGGIAANSICPKGWRLPNAASVDGGYEFSKLLYAYGVTKDDKNMSGYATGGYNNLISSPLYFVRSGNLSNGAFNTMGGFYSSGAVAISPANYTLYFTPSIVYPSDYYYTYYDFSGKGAGRSLRCLAE